ncbi:hypothetical protein L2E82_20512 [Cichorium intybus]|uniref:Uncharacterized protein n=1 Tax=Cichorium intybus TaxID=13427 RepID=A0ACB9DUD2_CICIN|nr:hypothetical protein L2E82_20512 [Cichorium intybus]
MIRCSQIAPPPPFTGHRPPAQPYRFLHKSDALKSLVVGVALFCYDRQQQLINLQQAVFPYHTLVRFTSKPLAWEKWSQQIVTQKIANVVQLRTEKIVAAVSIKKKDSLNKIENLKDHVSVSEDSRTSQMDTPLLKSKLNTDQEATPSFMSYRWHKRFGTLIISKFDPAIGNQVIS